MSVPQTKHSTQETAEQVIRNYNHSGCNIIIV